MEVSDLDPDDLTTGEFEALCQVLDNRFALSEENRRYIGGLIEKGLVFHQSQDVDRYEVTEAGKRQHTLLNKELEQFSAELQLSANSIAQLTTTSKDQFSELMPQFDWLRDNETGIGSILKDAQNGWLAAISSPDVFGDLNRSAVSSLAGLELDTLRSIHPTISTLDVFKSLDLKPDFFLEAASGLSMANTALFQASERGLLDEIDIQVPSLSFSESVINVALLSSNSGTLTDWSDYVGELTGLSRSIVDWFGAELAPARSGLVKVESTLAIGRSVHSASVPPAYFIASHEEQRARIADEYLPLAYTDEEIAILMTAMGHEYLRLWGGVVFAMNPSNPSRTKQVSYTVRELLQTYLDEFAPVQTVKATLGKSDVTRRERFAFVMGKTTDDPTVWVIDHLDALLASLDNTMSKLGHHKGDQSGDEVIVRAVVGMAANALALIESCRQR